MILRRLALFIAMLFGVGATQVPEFVEQYRQRLGGAIDELAAIVANFDSRSGQHGLTEAQGIDRLRTNSDPIAKGEGHQMEENVQRLQTLREAQTAFRSEGPVARLGTFVTHYDQRIARGAWSDFEPAVPTSPEAFVIGLLGFLIGGGAMHVAGRPDRRRRPREVHPIQSAT